MPSFKHGEAPQPGKPIGVVYWKNGSAKSPVVMTVGFIVDASRAGVTVARECRNGRYQHGCTIPQEQVLRIESFGELTPDQIQKAAMH